MEKIYKRRYKLTQFPEEMNLFATLGLLVINYPNLKAYVLVREIKIVNVNSHFKSFEVN